MEKEKERERDDDDAESSYNSIDTHRPLGPENQVHLPRSTSSRTHLPLVSVFRRGCRLLRLVTLLLSALRSTGGGSPEGVSLWDRSCMGTRLPPLPPEPTRRGAPGLLDSRFDECRASPGTGSGGAQCLGWYGRVLWGSERASILRTAWGEAAPNFVPARDRERKGFVILGDVLGALRVGGFRFRRVGLLRLINDGDDWWSVDIDA